LPLRSVPRFQDSFLHSKVARFFPPSIPFLSLIRLSPGLIVVISPILLFLSPFPLLFPPQYVFFLLFNFFPDFDRFPQVDVLISPRFRSKILPSLPLPFFLPPPHDLLAPPGTRRFSQLSFCVFFFVVAPSPIRPLLEDLLAEKRFPSHIRVLGSPFPQFFFRSLFQGRILCPVILFSVFHVFILNHQS